MFDFRKLVPLYINGDPNMDSRDEQNLYTCLKRNLKQVLDEKRLPNVSFCFNQCLTDLDIETQVFRVQDYRELYIDYMCRTCGVPRSVACDYYRLIQTETVRTNSLVVDLAKYDGDVLIGVAESNRGSHYRPTEGQEAAFAKRAFCDMIKRIKVSEKCEFVEINQCLWDENGIGSPEVLKQVEKANRFLQFSTD